MLFIGTATAFSAESPRFKAFLLFEPRKGNLTGDKVVPGFSIDSRAEIG